MGDPAGIGPQVLLRAAARTSNGDPGLLLLGDPGWLRAHPAAGGLELPQVPSPEAARAALQAGEPGPWVLACAHVEPGGSPGRPRPVDGRAALACIDAGAELAFTGRVDALVTAPVNKELIARWQPRFAGHTEYLAERAGGCAPVMLFAGITPQVALLTTHLPTATALTMIRRPVVTEMLARLHRHWPQAFGRAPAIGVAALNPHAGEGGRLGTEEARILAPAIADARSRGVDARGPYAADSIFEHGDIDVILALYHDQGTIIAKRAPAPSVNLTLGLPYVRTSPDHGTAYDRAANGDADVVPMAAAIRLAAELVGRRA